MTWLQRLSLYARHRYRAVFLATAALMAVALGLASRLRFDTDITKLLPREDPVIQAFLETIEQFGAVDYLLVAVRIPEGAAVEPYETYVDRLGDRLAALPESERVEFRLGESGDLLRELYPKAVLFLDEARRERLAERLSDEGIRDRVQQMRRLVGTPQGMASKQLLALDPLGLGELFLDRLASQRGSLSVDWTSGYYLARDHRMLLLLVKPVRPPQDVDFIVGFVDSIEREAAAVAAEWPQIAGFGGEAGAPGRSGRLAAPEIALGGSYLTTLDDARFIRRDALLGGASSFAMVLVLFLFAFRRLGPLLFAVVPLACGLILTFGFSQLTLGALSSATSGTAALLIGLGIDFVIVSYGRYVEERRGGSTLEEALAAMSGSSGRAVVTGAVTTAATFYAFTITEVTGLAQMGFLTGTGILFCVVAVLVLLPAMIAWRDDRHVRRQSEPNLYLHSFGTPALIAACMRRPRTVLIAGAVATLLAVAGASRLEFQESMATMRPPENRGVQVTKEIGDRFGSGFDYMMLAVHGNSPGAAIALADRAAEGAQRLVDGGVLYGYSGITSLIPPPAQQGAVLDWLGERRSASLDIARIRTTFEAALAAEGLRAEPFAEGMDLLATAIAPSGPLDLEPYRASPQGRALLDRFLQERDGVWTSVVYLYPPENRWRREAPPEAIALAEELGPRAVLTGTNVINHRVRQVVRTDAWVAAILGVALVTLLLWADFRSLLQAFLALVPLAAGIALMLGAMAALGMQLNFMNIFVTTMIIGIGVDYGLHVLHRYREVRDLDDEPYRAALSETGNAIVVAALSTVCGFGSLAFSHYPGLRSVGYVATLGALSTAFVAVTLLPAFLELRRRARRRAGLSETGLG